MKFKKNWKRFWTLNRHHAEGFTLVELIVVIAILAILGGIAVPAYSGYVEKANKTADIALASEVAHALTLYYYSHPNENVSGYVILTPTGAKGDGAVGDAAMLAVFGEGWDAEGNEAMSLKYDDWTESGRLMAIAKGDAYSGSVNDSTYINNVGTEELLNDVQTCVSALAGLIGSTYAGGNMATFVDSLSDDYKNVLIESGYEAGADGSWNGVDNTVITNAIVFGLASQYEGNGGTAIAEQFYNEGSPLIGMEISNDTGLAELAAWYASAEAYVAWANDESLNQEFAAMEGYLSNPGSITSATEVRTKMQALQNNIIGFATSGNGENMVYFTETVNGSTQAQKDGEAFVNLMRTVNELSGDYTNKDTMSSENLFTDGAVLNQMNNYVTTAGLAQTMGDTDLAGFGDSYIIVTIDANGKVLPELQP